MQGHRLGHGAPLVHPEPAGPAALRELVAEPALADTGLADEFFPELPAMRVEQDPIHRLNTALEGRYHIERELGEGGMATVYLADDLKHERKVALKVLDEERTSDAIFVGRFVAEAKRVLFGRIGIDVIAGSTLLCNYADKNERDVVFAACTVCQIYENRNFLVRQHIRLEDLLELIIIQHTIIRYRINRNFLTNNIHFKRLFISRTLQFNFYDFISRPF